MGKKAEAGTPKAISNAMKVKGIKSIIIKWESETFLITA